MSPIQSENFFDKFLNNGSQPNDDIHKIRLIRQVNGLNLFFTFLALGLIVPLYLFIPNCEVLIGLQIFFAGVYFLNLIFNHKGHLIAACRITIYAFELQLFSAMFMTNAWESSVLFVVIVYPLLASLVERSIMQHMIISLSQVMVFTILHYFFPDLNEWINSKFFMNEQGILVMHIISLFTIPVIAATIINIIFKENMRAREIQKRMLNEISIANRQLEVYTEQLKDEAQRLKAEVDIAQQIQLMMIPSPEEMKAVPDLDISATMRPADEVGGDYFDLIIQEKTCIIGIGDVTGHGLASGLIMMMAQTAIRSISEYESEDTAKFLVTLNRILYANIKRTKKDRNMTLALMTYNDRTFAVSGQHESILVRRNNGTVDVYDTLELGFYVGMIPEIDGQVSTMIFRLEVGESILLYSDGVTEAENENKQQFGLDRLVETFKKNGVHDAERMQRNIIKDVYNFMGQTRILDDITLMVIKQK